MSKTIKIILITLFSTLGCIVLVLKVLSYNKYIIDIRKAEGKIEIPVKTYNFGTISHNDSIHYDFKILNVGPPPVIFSNITSSCNCTSVEYQKNIIQPSETLLIKTKFKPKKENVGKNKITVFLNGNFEQEKMTLTLEGVVKN